MKRRRDQHWARIYGQAWWMLSGLSFTSLVSFFFFCFLFVHHLRSNGLAHGYPQFGWQIAFCLYTIIYHFSYLVCFVVVYIKNVVDRRILDLTTTVILDHKLTEIKTKPKPVALSTCDHECSCESIQSQT